MTKEQIQNEKMYLGTMATAKNLLKQGIISDEEYEQIFGRNMTYLCLHYLPIYA